MKTVTSLIVTLIVVAGLVSFFACFAVLFGLAYATYRMG